MTKTRFATTDIYRCSKKEGMYIYLPKGAMIDKIPDELKKLAGKLELAMTLSLTPESKLANAKVDKVIESVQSDGYYLQLPPKITDTYMYKISNDLI